MGGLMLFTVLILLGNVLGDEDCHVERPCSHLDVDCIRHYFLSTDLCTRPIGHLPDPLVRAHNRQFLPTFNGTMLLEDIFISGMKSDIVEFYINDKTDRAILAFRLKNFEYEAKKARLTYLPSAHEPVTAPSTKFSMRHPTVLFTVVFEGTRPLTLRHSFTHATVEGLPVVSFGPEPLTVKDHGFQAMYHDLLSDPMTMLREGYLTTAAHYSRDFVQNILCDYGIRDYN